MNVRPKAADWASALLAPSARKVAAALAHTSHDFGLIHWKAAAPRKPTGGPPAVAPERPAVAIFQASQHSTAAPHHLTPSRTTGLWRITLPRPNATTNIISPMPRETPSRQGRPRSTPTFAPVAVSSALLGPGVPAAATENRTNATVCSLVICAERRGAGRFAAWHID